MKTISNFLYLNVVIIVAAIAILSIFSLVQMHSEALLQAHNMQENQIETLWELLKEKGQDFRIVDGKLMAGSYVVNGNNELPDKVKKIFGGTATILMGDLRVSTNVLKEDGTRAVGTKLQGPARDAIFKEGKPYRGEALILGVPYFTAYDPIRNPNGEIIGALFVGVKKSEFFSTYDRLIINAITMAAVLITFFTLLTFLLVSVRKRAEVALQEREEKFRILAETLPAAICLYQGEKLIYVNPYTVRLLGYAEEELLKLKFWDFVHEDFQARVRELGLASQRGEAVPSGCECKHVTMDGAERWVFMSMGRIRYKEKPSGILTFIDITDRKRMEDELQRAHSEMEKRVEERTAELADTVAALRERKKLYRELANALDRKQALLRTLIDSIPDLIFYKDNEGVYLGCNKAFEDFAGRQEKDIIGFKDIDIFPGDVADFFSEMDQEMLCTGASHRNERWMRYPDGREVLLDTLKTLYYSKEAKILGLIGISRDISAHKRVEMALQNSRDELERRVAERTEQLTSLTAELSLVEERERRLIATELHDQVGQTLILCKIKVSSLSLSLSDEKFDEIVEELKAHISQSIEEIRSLTFQLSPPLLYEVGFEAAVEWLCEEFEGKYGFHVEFSDDGRPKPLNEETSVALFQMVRELLINVAKHAEANSVKISVGTISNKIIVIIADDGVGFAKSDGFWYWSKKSGFGLFNIRQRIEHMGGEFVIESEIGNGTRVTLLLPLMERKKSCLKEI